MREDGLRAKSKRRYKVTADSKHSLPVAPNLLNKDFSPEEPNQVYAGDITYIWTTEGWLFTRQWSSTSFQCQLSAWPWIRIGPGSWLCFIDALTMAVQRRRPLSGVIFHSDRGSQYASEDFQSLLVDYGMRCSMSRKDNCWDNAPVESFFGSLKQELVFHQKYLTRFHARQSLFEYIERFYNRRRHHSTLGYQSPAEYERTYFKLAA